MSKAEGVTSTPNVFSLHKQDDLLAAVRELNGHIARVADDLRMLCGLPHDPTIEIRLIDELIDLLDTLQLYKWEEREPDEDFEEGNDKEPSLGWTTTTRQEGEAFYGPANYEHDIDREGEHDGREPDVDDEEGGDKEPSLGWITRDDGRGVFGDDNDLEADLGTYDGMTNQEHAALSPKGGWQRGEEAGEHIQEKIDGARLRSKRRSARLQDGSDGALVVVTRGRDGPIVSVRPAP